MKYYGFILLVLIISILTGCSKDESVTLLSVQDDFLVYESDENQNFAAYTVDEEGILYTSLFKIDDISNKTLTYLNQYNLDGILTYAHEFDNISPMKNMVAKGEIIYFTSSVYSPNGEIIRLFSFNINTNDLQTIYEFDFAKVKNMVLIEDRIYILGMDQDSSIISSKSTEGYQSKGERLLYYSLRDGLVYHIDINVPINISRSEHSTLLINSYIEKEGYCILEYKPINDTIELVNKFEYYKFNEFAIANNGEDIIYRLERRNGVIVLSKLSSLEIETDLYQKSFPVDVFGIHYVKGQVYILDEMFNVVRFTLNELSKDTKKINYISTGTLSYEPFGCGYVMNRINLYPMQYTLKVLAGDKDYDISVMNSFLGESYNIRQNGSYYPLNDVEGIKEYLESCFPYVEEAAINESGDIWMLPLKVDIPAFLVREDSIERDGIKLTNPMNYTEFFELIENFDQKDSDKYNVSTRLMHLNFFNQLFINNVSVDSEEFRNIAALFKQYNAKMASANKFSLFMEDDFYYDSIDFEDTYSLIKKYYDMLSPNYKFYAKDNIEHMRAYSYPKLNDTDKNIGYCTFLTVNRNSSNLKETLNYIEDLIEYIMKQEDKPLFFKEYKDSFSPLRRSYYELYQNGNIVYSIDNELYLDGFNDLITKVINIEEYIKETQRKLDIFYKE